MTRYIIFLQPPDHSWNIRIHGYWLQFNCSWKVWFKYINEGFRTELSQNNWRLIPTKLLFLECTEKKIPHYHEIPNSHDLFTRQGVGGEPTLSTEVLINNQAYARCLEPAGPLWTTAHFPPPLLSQNMPGLELTKFPFVIVADEARVAVLRVSI